jgi:hypothetical protein
MKSQIFVVFVAALFAGVAQAFPAFQKSGDPQYAAFLKKAAEIRGGASIFEKRATNHSQQTGFEHRTLQALINPDSFKYNAEEQ